MNSKEILEEASKIVSGPRNETHGAPERNFATIAAYWSVYLQRGLTPRDVAVMMVLLKVARQSTGTTNIDHYIDMAGYSALAGELRDDLKGDA